jgi:ZIP family zinc transporter
MSWELAELLMRAVTAGVIASLACGMGALPLAIRGIDPKRHTGLGYGFAGGLMLSASVYNLIQPGLQMSAGHEMGWAQVWPVLLGLLLGSVFLASTDRYLSQQNPSDTFMAGWGGRMGLLIFLAMTVHSIPEGVAVGTAYAAGEVQQSTLGTYVALAIAIHNIPEGLAVAIPLRSAGASLSRCFWAATATSLPQPIAAIPAVLVSWVFQPIMPILMGFAAGAMIFLIILELIPEALEDETPRKIAWATMFGFCGMLLVQVTL